MKSFTAAAAQWISSPVVRRLLQIVVILLVVLFFGLALLDLAPKIISYPWDLQPTYLVLAFVVLVLRGPVPVYGWREILKQLGYTVPWGKGVRILYYSAMAGFLPGSVWHAVSRVYLTEKEGVPKGITTISVVLESVMILLAALVVAALSLIAWPNPPLWAAAIGLVVLAAVIWRPDVAFKAANWGLKRIGRQPLTVTLSPRDMIRLMLPFVLNWFIFGLMFYLILAALYPGISPVYIPLVAGIFTAAWVGGYIAIFIPQGWGVREIIIVTLLAVIGVPAPVATAAALLGRVWSILGVGIWAAIGTRL
ncbi:MAG: lysylphosphatidylglycerol synthase domain-containing protein [Chloroflexota bacterium]